MRDLAALVEQLGCLRLLVVGDLILDRYTLGDAERVSPEAPVPVLRAEEYEARPGGAASVAALLRALGAEVFLAGVLGEDADGRVLARLLAEAGVEACSVLRDPERHTTVKERFLGRASGRNAQQILRVDRESRMPLSPGLEFALTQALAQQTAEYRAVLISDYGKGVCTPGLLTAVLDSASSRGLPVLIDPARIADYSRYRRAELVKPNRVQAELAVGRPLDSPRQALAAGRELCARFGLGAVLVTLDRDGMALAQAGGAEEWIPACPRDVCDITGAGDMVLAVLGLCRGAGLALEAAAHLANVAAGLEVERRGVAPVNRAELRAALGGYRAGPAKQVTPEELTTLAASYRQSGRTIVFTNGCFDLLHIGHVSCLEEASHLGDVLVVAVNSDASVRALKGPGRPVIGEEDRAALVGALGCVDHVVIFGETTPLRLLGLLRPDVLVKGGAYQIEEVVGRELVESYGGRVCVANQREGVSTTRILQSLRPDPATVQI